MKTLNQLLLTAIIFLVSSVFVVKIGTFVGRIAKNEKITKKVESTLVSTLIDKVMNFATCEKGVVLSDGQYTCDNPRERMMNAYALSNRRLQQIDKCWKSNGTGREVNRLGKPPRSDRIVNTS